MSSLSCTIRFSLVPSFCFIHPTIATIVETKERRKVLIVAGFQGWWVLVFTACHGLTKDAFFRVTYSVIPFSRISVDISTRMHYIVQRTTVFIKLNVKVILYNNYNFYQILFSSCIAKDDSISTLPHLIHLAHHLPNECNQMEYHHNFANFLPPLSHHYTTLYRLLQSKARFVERKYPAQTTLSR